MYKKHKTSHSENKSHKSKSINTEGFLCPTCLNGGEIKVKRVNRSYTLCLSYINEYHQMINNILHSKYPEYSKLLIPEYPDVVSALVQVVEANDEKIRQSRILKETHLVEERKTSDEESDSSSGYIEHSPRNNDKTNKSRIPVLKTSSPERNPNFSSKLSPKSNKKILENNVITQNSPQNIVINQDDDFNPFKEIMTKDEFNEFMSSYLNNCNKTSNSKPNFEDITKAEIFQTLKYISKKMNENKDKASENNESTKNFHSNPTKDSEKFLNMHDLEPKSRQGFDYECLNVQPQSTNMFRKHDFGMKTISEESSNSDIDETNYKKSNIDKKRKAIKKIISSEVNASDCIKKLEENIIESSSASSTLDEDCSNLNKNHKLCRENITHPSEIYQGFDRNFRPGQENSCKNNYSDSDFLRNCRSVINYINISEKNDSHDFPKSPEQSTSRNNFPNNQMYKKQVDPGENSDKFARGEKINDGKEMDLQNSESFTRIIDDFIKNFDEPSKLEPCQGTSKENDVVVEKCGRTLSNIKLNILDGHERFSNKFSEGGELINNFIERDRNQVFLRDSLLGEENLFKHFPNQAQACQRVKKIDRPLRRCRRRTNSYLDLYNKSANSLCTINENDHVV